MKNNINNFISLEVEKENLLRISLRKILGVSEVEIIQEPTFGSLELGLNRIIYKPNENFVGQDFFSYIDDQKETGIVFLNVKDNVFKPRARLLIQLGDQLIKNESIALIELAKNSYDADASYCNVTMNNVEDRKNGSILIEDDGFGMDIKTVKNAWLEPGSDNKEIILKKKKVTPKFERLPIGEKGIGRFGVHKLGKKIQMVTRMKGEKEVVVNIDWREFEKYKYLDEAPVEFYEREPEIFTKSKTGTKISISELRKSWTRGMMRDVYRALNGISTPPTYDIDDILSPNSQQEKTDEVFDTFEANLFTDRKEWIADIPGWDEILQYSLFFFDIEIEGDRINKFKYKFRPWDRFSDLKEREVTQDDKPISDLLDISDPDFRKYTPLNHEGLRIGKFQFKGCIFIRDPYIYKIFNILPTSLTDYLNRNGGIRVYRNGVRVYDYGEPENDWLALDYRRFNNPGVKLSNNLMLASINLKRESSSDLIEKTNREGFIENQAYDVFKKEITYTLKLIELLRLEDKRKIDNRYKPQREAEPVIKSIEGLRGLVEEKVKDSAVKKEIKVYVDRIEKNYQFMNETMTKSASAGLAWSVYIHEIEKIIAEILKVLKRDKASDRMIRLTKHLSELIESYAQILRKTKRTNQSLTDILDQALFNVEYRLEAHGVEIVRADKKRSSINLTVARNLLVSNVMNIIDNSLYWLDRSRRIDKKIRFDIAAIEEGYISLIISDNGTGFSLSPEQMREPFVSTKPDGMGLGLYLVSEIMTSHKGKVSFNENGDYPVPNEFKNGATVILSFKA